MDGKGTHKKKLTVPHDPFAEDGGWNCKYKTETAEMKIVFEFSGINMAEQMELSIFDFWRLLRDAVIFNASQTDKGREFLDKAWAAEQTEPDRQTLRQIFGKGKG